MAVTGVVTVSDSAVKPGNRVKCTLTLTNDSTVVRAISIKPLVSVTGGTSQNVAAVVGAPGVGGSPVTQANPMTVTASTDSVIYFDVVFHAPSSGYGLSEPASLVYDIGAIVTILAADSTTRSMVTSTVANVTVTSPSWS